LALRRVGDAAEKLLEHDARQGYLLITLQDLVQSGAHRLLTFTLATPTQNRRQHAGVEQDHRRRRAFL
jgi:hypothetical protein